MDEVAGPLPEGARRLWLVGMMGAGKSTVARALADQLGWPLLDTDRAIEQRTGRTIAEIFADEGEAAFRRAESAALEDVARLAGPIVVSVGGGAVKSEANRDLLGRSGIVIWLRATNATLVGRLGTGRGRPLLTGAVDELRVEVARLAEERRLFYAEVADLVVDVDDLEAPDVARRVLAALASPSAP